MVNYDMIPVTQEKVSGRSKKANGKSEKASVAGIKTNDQSMVDRIRAAETRLPRSTPST